MTDDTHILRDIFPLPQTPSKASDAFLDMAFAITREHAANLAADPTLAARLDADPALRLETAEKLVREIDLRGLDLDLRYESHGRYRGKEQWTVYDNNSYDGEESAMGSGDSKEMALEDLLEKMEARKQRPRASTPIYTGRDEPNDYGPATRAKDIDGDDDR